MDFAQSFIGFLMDYGIDFRSVGNSFFFFDGGLEVRLVPLEEAVSAAAVGPSSGVSGRGAGCPVIHLYEDRWWGRGDVIRARLLAHLGCRRSIFARKCEVVKLRPEEAAAFLDSYHLYGSARCRYRYGLLYGGELVAVSTFSDSRPMPRIVGGNEVTAASYEWVRSASLPDCRICGGMGRMLKAFEDDVHPEDIMSYADCEWSDGAVYERLGFVRSAFVPPVEFVVDTGKWVRISCKKLGNDRAWRDGAGDMSAFPVIRNLGSIKYVRTLIGK